MQKPSPPRMSTPQTPSDAALSRVLPLLLVLVPVLFNAVMLWPELATGVPSKNDSAFHWLMINAASDALKQGRNPFDVWIPQLDLGYPQFLYYQNLPHLLVVALNRVLFGTIGLERIFQGVRYLLLVSFPLTVYWSMRRMEFSARAAAVSAVVCSLLSSDARYGFEYNSYLWRGLGVYTQLWGMHLFFVALACLHFALRRGQGYAAAIVSLAVLALSHLLFAYIMAITALILLVAVSDRRTILRNSARLTVIGVLALAMASYMLVPFVMSSLKYMSTLPGLNVHAHPPSLAIGWLTSGEVLDHDRLPVLTLLTVVGIGVAIWRFTRDASHANRLALGGVLVWMVLYVGHPTTTSLSNLFPAHEGFVTARFVGAFEVFAIMIIGVGGEWFWNSASRLRAREQVGSRFGTIAALAALFMILAPAFVERAHYYADNGRWIGETRDALASDPELKVMLQAVVKQPGGRLYAGERTNWGALMRVGPSIKVGDVVKYQAMPSVGPPYQALSLNSNFLWNFREGDEAAFDLMDVRWVLTPAAATVPPFYESTMRTLRYALYRVRTSGMAEYVSVTARRPVSTQRDLLVANTAWYLSSAPAARQYIRWDYMSGTGDFGQTVRCPDGGRIMSEFADAAQVRVEAECSAPSSMVLKMTYHPNWQVTVDGRTVPTYMASPSFLAFDLPAGRHVVQALYAGTPGKMALLVFGVVVLLATVVLGKRIETIPWLAP